MTVKLKSLSILSFLAIASIGSNNFAQSNEKPETQPKIPETESEKAKRFGMKEWNINGKIVYSATKKSAIKKANQIKKQ